MDFSELYSGAKGRFLERNGAVLPLIQLQYGRNERWFVREFALAMNQHLANHEAPRVLASYASCEYGYADLSVWERETLGGMVEAKALYSGRRAIDRDDVVKKARVQLLVSRAGPTTGLYGVFFIVYAEKGLGDRAKLEAFYEHSRASIRTHFGSDDDFRLSKLCDPTQVTFGNKQWTTASCMTWGKLAPHATP